MVIGMGEKFFDKSKKERVDFLEQQGFNVPKFIKLLSSPKEIIIFEKENVGKSFSFRSQSKSQRPEMGPHFPNVQIDEKLIDQLINSSKRYEFLVYEAIDPKNCVRRGNLFIDKSKRTFLIEHVLGPGTVREIENELPANIREVKGPLQDWINKERDEDFLFLGVPPTKIIELPFKSFILEFSDYKIPVGIKKMNGIFWEIRRG